MRDISDLVKQAEAALREVDKQLVELPEDLAEKYKIVVHALRERKAIYLTTLLKIAKAALVPPLETAVLLPGTHQIPEPYVRRWSDDEIKSYVDRVVLVTYDYRAAVDNLHKKLEGLIDNVMDYQPSTGRLRRLSTRLEEAASCAEKG